MSLTSAIAMTRENALLERSTESNQAPRPIVSSPPNASAEFESSTRSGGALCWERANGESVTPVVSPTSFGCPGTPGANQRNPCSHTISTCSLNTLEPAEAQTPDVGSKSDKLALSTAPFSESLVQFYYGILLRENYGSFDYKIGIGSLKIRSPRRVQL